MPLLYVEKGPDKGARIEIHPDRPVVLGREAPGGVSLKDHLISRRHFQILRGPGGIRIRDLKSRNGTLVNGRRVAEEVLRHGDRIQAGDTVFTYLDTPGEAAGDPLVGRTLEGYRVERRIGRGGMGTVYRATQLSLARPVALKVLHPELTANRAFVERFLEEARAAAKLNHFHIIQVHDVGQSGPYHYLSMEFMDAGSVADLLRQSGRLPLEQALPVLRDAARGLEYAERAGIVHRDIKPDNLLRNREGATKIGDLGIAKWADATGFASQAEGVFGTPYYTAPEQARGEPVDHRADLYALGATFFHLLAGRPPYLGSEATDTLGRQAHGRLPSLRELRPDIHPDVARMTAGLLAKEPGERYPDATVLLKDIEEIERSVIRGGAAKPGRGTAPSREEVMRRLWKHAK